MSEKNYYFGEKTKENINGVECPVWQTPRYEEAKEKVIETLKSDKYKNVLKTSDFWILMNTYANKTKVMYSGLIISHNGCLKINDILEKPFNPKALTLDKEGYNGSLVYTYCDDDIYEVGEVSAKNCKNDYPYAMALKRCFDRVVLKKCKLAYAGIYSDSEAEEFKEKQEEQVEEKSNNKAEKQAKNESLDKKQTNTNTQDKKQFKPINEAQRKILEGLPLELKQFICKKYNIPCVTDLPSDLANGVIQVLVAKGALKNENLENPQ